MAPKPRRSTHVDPSAAAAETDSIADLALAIRENTEAQEAVARAQQDVAYNQHTTNLIVRAQIMKDPAERSRLMDEAARRMDEPRRRDMRR